MQRDLSDYRKTYEKGDLSENSVSSDPMDLFRSWFQEIEAAAPEQENNAMSVSSIGLDGFPKTRVVLLKKFDSEGFIFYTNYNSEKGQALANDNRLCASFFWPALERQVIIKGRAVKIDDEVSDSYFSSRPKGSQLGAIASNQSEVVSSRQELDLKLQELTLEFENKTIKRPKNWGGYQISAMSIEFWQGRPNRMHDRLRYTLQKDKSWKLERLAP